MAYYRLDEKEICFPDPSLAEEDGLLAIGGDLSVDRLVFAYSNGIFPWYNEGQPIMWWCPKTRFIIRPESIHISKSMKKFMKRHRVSIQINRDFKDTMHRCRMKREDTVGTWITDDMERAYYDLYEAGFALSVESFVDGELAGGLYGVCLGRCFYGESMFTDRENGSKIALILLAKFLKENDFLMIDCQFETDHLLTMGGENISYKDYMEIVREGLSH